MQHSNAITPLSWLAILVLGLTWGGTFLVIELALETLTPFWIAAARIAFATVLTLGIWALMGRKIWHGPERAWGALVVVGATSSAIPFMLLSWGQQFVSSGFAGVSMAAVALLVLPLSHFFVAGERMTHRRILGLLIGFGGVLLLIGANAFTSTGAALETQGRLACLGAAACYAIGSVVMRRLPPIDPIGLAAVPMVFGSAIVIPAAYLSEGLPQIPEARTLLILAFLGLVPTAGANFLRVWVIRTAGPVFMSLTNYQVPVWSVLLGALILSEPLPGSLLMAMALILAGVGLTQYGALSRLFKRG
ncbi:DMT family transporter [uncultured Lentibacter sp.]|uniref:DMT family transporter n=1 Tax=uncultured Lentibacter sp. TaxID=1659309 RepID=UPI00261DA571|nr:DMT family transporter [uncultured Lentibacter sp.]MCW1955996.1 DMT family transporter [Roseobacter sp.]